MQTGQLLSPVHQVCLPDCDVSVPLLVAMWGRQLPKTVALRIEVGRLPRVPSEHHVVMPVCPDTFVPELIEPELNESHAVVVVFFDELAVPARSALLPPLAPAIHRGPCVADEKNSVGLIELHEEKAFACNYSSVSVVVLPMVDLDDTEGCDRR